MPFGIPSGIVTNVVGGLILVLIIGVFRLWRNRKKTTKEWYQDASTLAARVDRLGYRATEYQEKPDVEALKKDLDPLSDELIAHAGDAPDEDSERELEFLAKITTGLVIIAKLGESYSGTELFTLFQEYVKDRAATNEELPDIEVVNNLLSLIDKRGIVEDLPTDVEFDEELLEGVLSEVSEETQSTGEVQSIEEAMEFPFDEANAVTDGFGVVDEILDDVMREYLRLWLLGVTGIIQERMEQRKTTRLNFRE